MKRPWAPTIVYRQRFDMADLIAAGIVVQPMAPRSLLLEQLWARRSDNYESRYVDFCRHCDLHEIEHVNKHCLLMLTSFEPYDPS